MNQVLSLNMEILSILKEIMVLQAMSCGEVMELLMEHILSRKLEQATLEGFKGILNPLATIFIFQQMITPAMVLSCGEVMVQEKALFYLKKHIQVGKAVSLRPGDP